MATSRHRRLFAAEQSRGASATRNGNASPSSTLSGRFVFTSLLFDFSEEHRDHDLTALAKLREHVQQELGRQKPFCGVSSRDLLYLKTPKQPDSASCGVCVLIIIELMAT